MMRSLGIALLLLSFSCTNSSHKKQAQRTHGLPLDSLSVSEMIPTSGSGAYFTAGARLWYVEGATAIMVRTPSGDTVEPYNITPTSGRGVYVEQLADDRIWYVEGAKAVPLREVSSVDALDTVAPAWSGVVGAYMEKHRRAQEEAQYRRDLAAEASEDPR